MGFVSWLKREPPVRKREDREDLRTKVTLRRLDTAVEQYNRRAMEFELADLRRRKSREGHGKPGGA